MPIWALQCRNRHLNAAFPKSAALNRALQVMLIGGFRPNQFEEKKMAARRSRTYRLRLSGEGTERFLGCHHRLARLTGSLIPYGATLFVAMLLTAGSDTAEIAAEVTLAAGQRSRTDKEHFVGASDQLSAIEAEIGQLVEQTDMVSARPPQAVMFMAGIAIMAASEDKAIMAAFDRMTRLIADS
ncbi:MAG: hypothetical protein U9R64_04700 [Pseudomonadota bacterium]|nr:hypothetical protein [Pseudomonadota bacterium]